MMTRALVVAIYMLLVGCSEIDGSSVEESSCSAKNDAGGTCEVSCPVGEAAYCQDNVGALEPTCECRSEQLR